MGARVNVEWFATADKLRQTAAELRQLVQATTKQSAITQTLQALAANYDALAEAQNSENAEIIHGLLTQLLDEYARMGWLLVKAQRLLTVAAFAEFLTKHAIDHGLAVHAIQFVEGQLVTH
jgi:cell division septum initiation protein DivIVA